MKSRLHFHDLLGHHHIPDSPRETREKGKEWLERMMGGLAHRPTAESVLVSGTFAGFGATPRIHEPFTGFGMVSSAGQAFAGFGTMPLIRQAFSGFGVAPAIRGLFAGFGATPLVHRKFTGFGGID